MLFAFLILSILVGVCWFDFHSPDTEGSWALWALFYMFIGDLDRISALMQGLLKSFAYFTIGLSVIDL